MSIFIEARDKNSKLDFVLKDSESLFIALEAKKLGTELNGFEGQVIGYANRKNAKQYWAILSDGNEYRLYNSYAGDS